MLRLSTGVKSTALRHLKVWDMLIIEDPIVIEM